jgi:hypothetical protein
MPSRVDASWLVRASASSTKACRRVRDHGMNSSFETI